VPPESVLDGEVSLVRLYILRAMYLVLVIGLGGMIVPEIVSHRTDQPRSHREPAGRRLAARLPRPALSAGDAPAADVRVRVEADLDARLRPAAMVGRPASADLRRGFLQHRLRRGHLKVILNRGITGAPRIARHLWRMCLALFVAVGSFFLGQQRVMPEYMQGSPWLSVPPLAVLATMLFWLLKLRFAKFIARLKRRLRRPEAIRLYQDPV
jgi:hypothetical protein